MILNFGKAQCHFVAERFLQPHTKSFFEGIFFRAMGSSAFIVTTLLIIPTPGQR